MSAGQLPFMLYLMTFADNLTSFHCGINAVGHMEQEDPWPSRHTLHIYTSLQLETNTYTHTMDTGIKTGEAEHVGRCVDK